MTASATTLVCAGCGAVPPAGEPYPFRCPNFGRDDIDHVLIRQLDPGLVRFPSGPAAGNPFVQYRHLLHSYHRARVGGVADADFIAMIEGLDAAVADVDGTGFSATPFQRDDALSTRLGFDSTGGVWVKDETRNVAGSHKARHLMGILLHLEVSERLGTASSPPVLAIASCGNAALAAAVLARAGGRLLRVFVPDDADRDIVDRLRRLDAHVVTCPRRPDEAGDPAYLRLRDALLGGAVPFTCQGNQNGLAIEGAETLGFEIVSTGADLDHLVVQVGGGALASACVQSLNDAVLVGALPRTPRIHTVQTSGAHPLERAYRLVADELTPDPDAAAVDAALRTAAAHRSRYMWPWETQPRSIATGILDDETYDWLAVIGGMLRTGGQALVVSEEGLVEANRLGGDAGYPVDPTGSSGLAGLFELRRTGVVSPQDRVAVLFTGVRR